MTRIVIDRDREERKGVGMRAKYLIIGKLYDAYVAIECIKMVSHDPGTGCVGSTF